MRNISKFLVVIILLSILLTGCGNDNGDVDIDNLEYIEESELGSLYSTPKKYKDKGVKLYGKVFSIEEDEKDRFIQVWVNINGYEENTIVADYDSNGDYQDGDFVFVDGIVLGEFKGENAMGATIIVPKIEAIKVEKSSYIDAVSPTIKEVDVGTELTQHNATVNLNKIQFAKDETRIYIDVENNSGENLSIWTHSAKIIQNGKQYENEYNFDANYPEIPSELVDGVSTTAILSFKSVDMEFGSLTFQIDGSLDNWELKIEPFIFQVNW